MTLKLVIFICLFSLCANSGAEDAVPQQKTIENASPDQEADLAAAAPANIASPSSDSTPSPQRTYAVGDESTQLAGQNLIDQYHGNLIQRSDLLDLSPEQMHQMTAAYFNRSKDPMELTELSATDIANWQTVGDELYSRAESTWWDKPFLNGSQTLDSSQLLNSTDACLGDMACAQQ